MRTILVLSAFAVAARQLFVERGTIGNKICYLFAIIVADVADEYRERHLLRDVMHGQVYVMNLIQRLHNERTAPLAFALLVS